MPTVRPPCPFCLISIIFSLTNSCPFSHLSFAEYHTSRLRAYSCHLSRPQSRPQSESSAFRGLPPFRLWDVLRENLRRPVTCAAGPSSAYPWNFSLSGICLHRRPVDVNSLSCFSCIRSHGIPGLEPARATSEATASAVALDGHVRRLSKCNKFRH